MSDNPRELNEIQLKADNITNETLEVTRQMKQLACETREIGASTAQDLQRQGEQLDKIEGDLDEINQDLKKAEKHLTNMEKCCGLCLCPCARPSGIKGSKSHDTAWQNAQKINNGGTVTTQPTSYQKQEVAKSGYVKKITNDAREDEMDENLAVVADVVGDLKMMALDMGDELERQNEKLDRMNKKTDLNVDRVRNAEARTQKLLDD